MSGLFTALAVSAGAGLAGSLASGAMQSSSAKSGTKAAQNASLWGWNTGAPYYDTARQALYPYSELGDQALWQIRNNMGWNPGQADGNGMWEQPMNLRTAADAAGLDYNAITQQIGPEQLKALTGYTPREAYAPITRGKLNDFTGLNVQKTLGGYNTRDVQRASGVDLSGLFNSVGSVGIKNPQQPKQQGLTGQAKGNFEKLHGLAQQGKLNDTQQANYLRLLGKMGG